MGLAEDHSSRQPTLPAEGQGEGTRARGGKGRGGRYCNAKTALYIIVLTTTQRLMLQTPAY